MYKIFLYKFAAFIILRVENFHEDALGICFQKQFLILDIKTCFCPKNDHWFVLRREISKNNTPRTVKNEKIENIIKISSVSGFREQRKTQKNHG